MRTIIKITKQEAIDAWKAQNKYISKGEDTTVEIEDTYSPTYTISSTTNKGLKCLSCGKEYLGTEHQCSFFQNSTYC